MDGLITGFFKPVGGRLPPQPPPSPPQPPAAPQPPEQRRPPEEDKPSLNYSIISVDSDDSLCEDVESVVCEKLMHVQQRDPAEKLWTLTSHYVHRKSPTSMSIPIGCMRDLCTLQEEEPSIAQPLPEEESPPVPRHILSHYQQRTPCDLSLSIRVTKRRRKIAVAKSASLQGGGHNLNQGLWVDTYRPLTCGQVCGNSVGIAELCRWLCAHQGKREKFEDEPTNALLLLGPPGSGKTAAVYAVAAQLGINVHEVNCSAPRDKASLLSALQEATRSYQVSGVSIVTHSLILIEEADVVFSVDKGFWSTVTDLLLTTKRPFIFTANDSSLTLDLPHEVITFPRPTKEELAVHLRAVALCHNVNLSSKLACQIADSLNCDIRQAFNYLQLWLCWSPGNQPMLHSHHRTETCTLPDRTELCCDVDVLSCAECPSVNNWWTVVPQDSVSDHPRYTHHCEGARHVWAELATKVTPLTFPSLRDREVGLWMDRVSTILSPCRTLSRAAMVTDILPMMRVLCNTELQREAINEKRRFTHYLRHTGILSADLKHPPQLI